VTKAYDTIRAGLEEALAHAKVKSTGAVAPQIKVPDPDVAAIRAKSGLSQAEFACSIGAVVGTLRG
jgi:putative transcriptional regulator